MVTAKMAPDRMTTAEIATQFTQLPRVCPRNT